MTRQSKSLCSLSCSLIGDWRVVVCFAIQSFGQVFCKALQSQLMSCALQFDESRASWRPMPSFGVRRHLPGVCAHDGQIWVVGGSDDQWIASAVVEVFPPQFKDKSDNKSLIRLQLWPLTQFISVSFYEEKTIDLPG